MSQHRSISETRRKILANNIRKFVTEDRSTKSDIAVYIGVSVRQLDRYMNGTSEPLATTLYLLAQATMVDVKRFFMTESEWKFLSGNSKGYVK